MARWANINFTGTQSGLSFYKRYGKHFVRTKSQGGKQTPATKGTQKYFALAASLAATIRLVLQGAIPNPKQRAMQNRLTKALMQWALTDPLTATAQTNINPLNNFQFIEETPLQSIFSLPVTINTQSKNTLQITLPSCIPKQAIKAPTGTKQVRIIISAGSCSTNPVKELQHFQCLLEIKYNNKPSGQHLVEFPVMHQ